ncbi:hypothetical protein V495_04567 [Pseudogymnoascus sp. VKM F-4514 (FW-929)]|nr:hypothetical protein V495_04567 [Pseudogymnoascus sp. VKM F-4514 (FW-929)]KFY60867.1 hypothetical protein V497_03350 [Pseudogymnoascus sp. VKM F-4516 (FW-969)]
MRAKRFHGLKAPKIRMSMSKYNLYNLSQLRRADTFGTYFQQKWFAKRETRAYHGEQVREKKWQRMFTSRIKSVVPMNHRYMALFDGSEQAAGRGSGVQTSRELDSRALRARRRNVVPYMGMTFAPVERRLDTAIFRALFASSARQARQFVLHGGVKVNGKKMTYPGYLLNPGDMFQVEPDRVLFATGAPKESQDVKATKAHRKRQAASKATASTEETTSEETSEEATPAEEPVLDEAAAEKKQRKEHKDNLQSLLASARAVLEDKGAHGPSAKKKQEIRAFAATVRRAIGNVPRTTTEDLDAQVAELVSKLSAANVSKPAPAPAPTSGTVDPSLQAQVVAKTQAAATNVPKQDVKMLAKALREVRENPIDAPGGATGTCGGAFAVLSGELAAGL